ncbi:hypothetical protein HMPREF3212_03954 [Citrobacter freundii]|nr:hypothetical protein HMPREF3212_03954 [Citrobacter freundii]
MDILIQHQHYLRENTCRALKEYYWGCLLSSCYQQHFYGNGHLTMAV